MEIKEEYEIIGREIDFDDIRGIDRIFQPGLLSRSRFFDMESLNQGLLELCGYGAKDILVYFNRIEDISITSNKWGRDRTRETKWWDAFQHFVPLVRNLPAGCKLEYYYGQTEKEYTKPDFIEKEKPFQAFVRLFDNAIQGYSCFVNSNPSNIRFRSERNNYPAIQPGEGLTHDFMSLWIGSSEVFQRSAEMLSIAFAEMDRSHVIKSGETSVTPRREVRIIYPERGALISSLYKGSSVSLLLKNSEVERNVATYRARQKMLSDQMAQR